MSDPFADLKIDIKMLKKPIEKTAPGGGGDEIKEQEMRQKQMNKCMHLKKIINNYMRNGSSNPLKLNIYGISQIQEDQLKNKLTTAGFQLEVNENAKHIWLLTPKSTPE